MEKQWSVGIREHRNSRVEESRSRVVEELYALYGCNAPVMKVMNY